MKKRSNQNIIWGILLIIFGITALIDTFLDLTIWSWVIVLFLGGLFAGIVNWNEREKWINFLPTYVLWSIAGLIALIRVGILIDVAIPVYVLWIIGLPFLIGYFRNRLQWGMLIPAYVLFSVGLMVGLIGLGWLQNFLIPAYVMLAIAAPFFLVYVINKENWWALIPAGIMATIAVGFLFASSIGRFMIPLVIILIGLWIIVRIVIRK